MKILNMYELLWFLGASDYHLKVSISPEELTTHLQKIKEKLDLKWGGRLGGGEGGGWGGHGGRLGRGNTVQNNLFTIRNSMLPGGNIFTPKAMPWKIWSRLPIIESEHIGRGGGWGGIGAEWGGEGGGGGGGGWVDTVWPNNWRLFQPRIYPQHLRQLTRSIFLRDTGTHHFSYSSSSTLLADIPGRRIQKNQNNTPFEGLAAPI